MVGKLIESVANWHDMVQWDHTTQTTPSPKKKSVSISTGQRSTKLVAPQKAPPRLSVHPRTNGHGSAVNATGRSNGDVKLESNHS